MNADLDIIIRYSNYLYKKKIKFQHKKTHEIFIYR